MRVGKVVMRTVLGPTELIGMTRKVIGPERVNLWFQEPEVGGGEKKLVSDCTNVRSKQVMFIGEVIELQIVG